MLLKSLFLTLAIVITPMLYADQDILGGPGLGADSGPTTTPEITNTPKTCDQLLAFSGSKDQAYRVIFAHWAENWQDSLSGRGFNGAAIPDTPYSRRIAMEFGQTQWGGKWVMAPSLEEAIRWRLRSRAYHVNKGTPYSDLTLAGLYFIGTDAELGVTHTPNSPTADAVEIPPEKVAELIARGAYDIDHEGNVTFITPEQLARHVSTEGMVYHNSGHIPGAFGINSITQSGWVAWKMHGIHDFSTWKDTPAAKKLAKRVRQLLDQGYTFRFNTDYKAMLDKIKGQMRSQREYTPDDNGNFIVGERKEMNMSRYADDKTYNSMLKILESGQGYSVGLYDPNGVLLAGEVGVRNGNHLYGDSIYYDEIENGKLTAYVLFEALYAQGMPYSDPGMITPYTAAMGAELVPFPEYLKKIRSGPTEHIQLPAVYDSRPADFLDTAFADLDRIKSQGLGNLKVVRRLPIATDAAKATAARLGFERSTLNLVFVSSPEEAAADVATRTWDTMPVYIELASVPQAQGPTTTEGEAGVQPSAQAVLQLLLSDPLAEKAAAEKNLNERRNEERRLRKEGADEAQLAAAAAATQEAVQALTAASAMPIKAYFIPNARFPTARKDIALNVLADVLQLDVIADAPVWTGPNSIAVNGWGKR